MTYDGREIFAHAPLVFVTAEARLGYEPLINNLEIRDRFGLELRDILPVLESEMLIQATFSTGGEPASPETLPMVRALNRDRTIAVGLNAHALSVEAVEYSEFVDFKHVVSRALAALESVLGQIQVQRLGLRYIDEVRAPGISQTRDWATWLSASLLAPLSVLPNEEDAEGLAGQLVFHHGNQLKSLFRWGEVRGSTVLNPSSKLRVRQPAPSRFFVLDVDSFWESEALTAMSVDEIGAKFEELHDPAGKIFMASLTEHVKGLFRGTEPDD